MLFILERGKGMSIKTKLVVLIGGASALMILLLTMYFVSSSNKHTEELAMESTYNQARMLAITMHIGREYLAKTIASQPTGTWKLTENTINFIPAKFGTSVGLQLENEANGYKLKQTAMKVTNPKNAPDEYEINILKKFAADRSLKEFPQINNLKEGIQVVENRKVFRYAFPFATKAGCLLCHSDPKVAPKVVNDLYPQNQAFGFQEGEFYGMLSVTVPWEATQSKISAMQAENTKAGFTAGFILVAVVLVIVWLVGSNIVAPLNIFSQVAEKVSKGDVQASIPENISARKDEIGTLAGSFGRMIASLKVFMGGE